MSARSRRIDALRGLPLFAEWSTREIAQVADIAADEQYAAGQELTREGEPGRSFYVIVAGRAEVYQGGEKINEHGPGAFFGEIALIAHSLRTATVTAATPLRALVIADRKFRALLGRQPHLQVRIVEALRDRVLPSAER